MSFKEVPVGLQQSSSRSPASSDIHRIKKAQKIPPSTSSVSGTLKKELNDTNLKCMKKGWLWKWSIGRSMLGRKNWKLRFIDCDEQGLKYYVGEPFVKAKGVILWKDVIHVYSDSPSDDFIVTSGGTKCVRTQNIPDESKDYDCNFGDSKISNLIGTSSSSSSQQRPHSPNTQFAGNAYASYYELKANSPQTYYFGLRIRETKKDASGAPGGKNEGNPSCFSVMGTLNNINVARTTSELTLMFKTEHLEDHREWVAYLTSVCELYGNINGRELDNKNSPREEDVNPNDMSSGGGMIERIRRALRGLVSLQKRRYKEDGHDLDLAYILPNLIAMGFPCEGREEMFRNPMSHVLSFFNKYHKQYKVYNLCSERHYPPSRFGGSFERFPFDDHNPCPLQMLLPLCESIFTWILFGDNCGEKDIPSAFKKLKKAKSKTIPITVNGKTSNSTGRNKLTIVGPDALLHEVLCLQHTDCRVAAIHCKAGKGRTGLASCAYLLYSGACSTVEEALSVFGSRRTYDGKGIQIPSQCRYLRYFTSVLKDHKGSVPSAVVSLYKLILTHSPTLEADGSSEIYIQVSKRKDKHRHIPSGKLEGRFDDQLEVILNTFPKGIATGNGVVVVDKEYEAEEVQIPNKAPTYRRRLSPFSRTIRTPRVIPDPSKRLQKDYTNQVLYFTNQDVNKEGSSVPAPLVLRGVTDFLISLVNVTKAGNLQRVASFWLHTGFMPSNSDYGGGDIVDNSTGKPLSSIVIPKAELDNATKDKNNRQFPSDFKVILGYTVDGAGPTIPWSGIPIPSTAE